MNENERQNEQVVLLSEKAEPVRGKDPRTPKAKKAKQVAEIPAYRNTVRDAYRLDDGTEVAIFYPQAVHSFDGETQSFVPVEKTITDAEDDAHFMGGKNGFGIRFNKEAENDELFDISQGQHRVTVFTKRNQKQKNKMCSVRSGETDTLVISNAQTGGADLEYSVNGGGVKENIVIKKKAKTYRYAFVLKCENVTAEFDKAAKRVAFISTETGKEVFFIPAPFMTDANGHTMKATYNSIGQMIAEKWYDGETLIAEYRYIYDGQGNIVRSLDFAGNKEYNYQYEEGRITRATEKDITVNDDGMITSKTLVNTILYLYDAEGNMTRKRIMPAGGEMQEIWYENPENGNTVVKFAAGDRTVTSHSKSDSFGRKVFDELQLGTGFVSRQFSYHAGEKTDEHANSGKLKSSPTTQLVSQIVLSGGRSISYEYDAEERITKVTDSVDGITEYTYDALGQLLTETIGEVTTKFKYDQYGNILAKGVVDETGEIAEATKITYEYSKGPWKDLLIGYNGQSITYDAQGNPVSYLGHTLTWEKGRQLKSFDGNTYTYNANGIRTSKTVNGVRHDFVLDGTKILRETWGENVLIPLYDNENSICGICFNGEFFYFHKNQQGDIIAIVDDKADVVAQYSYDAWGVCTIVSDTSACSIATINPFRYRGYYYDVEIGMYYLQTRYYDSNISRFVTLDDPAIISSTTNTDSMATNKFCYCLNSPINGTDENGTIANFIVQMISNFIWGFVGGVLGLYLANVTLNIF